MNQNRDAYPELLYAITADLIRAMRDEQAVRELRHARRRQRLVQVRTALRGAVRRE